jgi:predicted permease
MKALRRLWRRLLGSLAGGRRDHDLARELDSHIQMMTDDHVRRGRSPEEARRLALVTFGGVEVTKERYRDQRGLPSIDSIRQDVTFAWRTWRRNPGFAAIAVLTLGVGLGANTAVFALLNSVLLKPLPVRDAHQLRVLKWVGNGLPVSLNGRLDQDATGWTVADAFSADAYRHLRDRAPDLTDVVALSQLRRVSVIGRGDAFAATGVLVSGNFFGGLGTSARPGRTLAPGDDRPGADPVVVISSRCWRTEFGADPGALGRTVSLNGFPFTLIGVLSEEFRGLFGNSPTDLYVPLSAQAQVRPATPWDSPGTWSLQIMARLRPGADERRAAATAAALFNATVPAPSSAEKGPRKPHGIILADGSRGLQYSVREGLTVLLMLAGAAAIVLLVACANVAGLQLVRGDARRHELAIRMALGAGRWRLARRALTESLLLSLAGGALGLLLAAWGTTVLSRPIWQEDTALDLAIDHRVFGFALALSIVAALLAGLLPAIRTTRTSPAVGLAGRTMRATPRLRTGRSLVSIQVGLSLLLLVGAGLFTRTLVNLYRVDTGFDPASVLVFSLDASTAGYKGRAAVDVYERVLGGLRSSRACGRSRTPASSC